MFMFFNFNSFSGVFLMMLRSGFLLQILFEKIVRSYTFGYVFVPMRNSSFSRHKLTNVLLDIYISISEDLLLMEVQETFVTLNFFRSEL